MIFSGICKLLVLLSGEHQFMIRTFSHKCLAKLMFKRRECLVQRCQLLLVLKLDIISKGGPNNIFTQTHKYLKVETKGYI